MHDPTEPDRYEILDGPGRGRRSARNRPSNQKKIIVIAASALVTALAVGGAGYVLTAGPGDTGTPAQQSQQAEPEQGAGEGEPLEDDAADEATMGDADTDLPEEEAAEMGDAAVGDTSGNTGNTGGNSGNTASNRDTGNDSSGKSTANRDGNAGRQNDGAKKPTTEAKPPPADEGDNPADGPAGAVNGQCSTSGC